MTKTKKILLLLTLALLSACHKKAPSGSGQLLLVSLPPYQMLVQKIAGDEFEVRAVVPLNADPHNYEPTSKQLTTIASGKIWFKIGESFEKKLLPLLHTTKVVDLRDRLTLISGGCKHHIQEDKHVWLSPKLLITQGEQITASLSAEFPEQKDRFETNFQSLKAELLSLDHEIEERLIQAKNKIFLVSHPAFAYFCRDYQCKQLSVEHEGKEPRPQELEQILNAAIVNHAALAIALPQHNNKGAQVIAEKLRIPVRFIDPYAPDYAKTMRKLTDLIVNPNHTEP